MASLPYIVNSERVVGSGHPVYADTLNRALQQMLTSSGHNATGTFAGIAGPMYNVVAFGADLTGAVDSAAAITAAQAAAGTNGRIHFPAGTYKISSNLTISAHTDIAPGAKLQPANGVTVTPQGAVLAGDHTVYDYSAGGFFDFSTNLTQKEFKTAWFGVKGDKSTNDQPALAHAFAACFGAPTARNGISNVHRNRRLMLGAGWHELSDEIDATQLYGFRIEGPGRQMCSLVQTTAGKRILNLDTSAYGSIVGINFEYGGGSASSAPLLDLDTSGAFPTNTVKTQQITFIDCTFNGNSLGDIGVQIGKTGGNAQGDTILFLNCLWLSCQFGGLVIGDRNAVNPPAYNALGILLIGGDIQSCMKYGVYCYGGQIFVDGTSCQNNQTMGQLDAAGCDFYFPIFAQGSVLKNVRSESCVLTNAQSSSDGIVIENCDVHCGNVLIGGWSSATAYVKGALWMFSGAQSNSPFANNPQRQSGRAYMAWQGGVSDAANEPDMVANDSSYSLPPIYQTNATTNSASVHVTFGTGNFQASHVGWKASYINPANGTREYRTIAAVNSSTDISLDVAPTFSAANVTFRAAKGITDGTVIWMAYDFYVIQGSISYMIGGMYQCGRIIPGAVFPRMILYPRVSRVDWWAGSSPGAYNVGAGLGPHHGMIGAIVGQGNAQGVPIAHPNINTDANSSPALLKAGLSFGDGFTIDGGDGGWQWVSLGIVRGDSTHFYDSQAGQRNVTGVLQTLGKVAQTAADTVGVAFDAQPGMGTGTRGSGPFNRWYQPSGGATGTAQSNRALADQIEAETGRYIGYRGRAISATATTNVAGAGTYTPDAAAAEVHRLNAQGATLTVANPLNPVNGARIVLDIANGSGGASACTLGAAFLGTFTMGATGKRRTLPYVYDSTAAKWVPSGSQSGDL